jgi:hypothetical protein
LLLVNQEDDKMENSIIKNEYYTSPRDEELTEFLCWMLEQNDWDHEIGIIRSEEFDRFWNSKIEDDVMDMKMVQADNFYEEFEKFIGINDFDECFVHMKYIDYICCNSVSLIMNVNGILQRFIIDLI